MKGRKGVEGGRGRVGGVICGHRRHGEKVLKGESPKIAQHLNRRGQETQHGPEWKTPEKTHSHTRKKKQKEKKKANFFGYHHELRQIQVGQSLKRGGDAALSASHILTHQR